MGSATGALRTAAKRVGLPPDEYAAHVAAGEKWRRGCRGWHPVDAFARDRSRGDGRKATCRRYDKARHAATYQRIPDELRKPMGPAPAPARDGDRRQARRRINVLVRTGRLPKPNDLPCVDCGHEHTPDERRHEYDHFRGYAAEHHLDVEVVCSRCHHARERVRAA